MLKQSCEIGVVWHPFYRCRNWAEVKQLACGYMAGKLLSQDLSARRLWLFCLLGPLSLQDRTENWERNTEAQLPGKRNNRSRTPSEQPQDKNAQIMIILEPEAEQKVFSEEIWKQYPFWDVHSLNLRCPIWSPLGTGSYYLILKWIDQWNRMGSPAIDPHIYSKLIFSKHATVIYGERIVFSTNGTETAFG